MQVHQSLRGPWSRKQVTDWGLGFRQTPAYRRQPSYPQGGGRPTEFTPNPLWLSAVMAKGQDTVLDSWHSLMVQ